jgi:hypothetical protein
VAERTGVPPFQLTTIMDDPISEAADLAERLVDEVASPSQDWRTIRLLADELAKLAERLTGPDQPHAGSS